MNTTDALNAAIFTLNDIKAIAKGETVGLQNWSDADGETTLQEIAGRAADTLQELRTYPGHRRGDLT